MNLIVLIATLSLSAQVAEKANTRYYDPNQRAGLAANLTREGRDAQQKPAELVAALGLQPGMKVADLGSGPGYLLPWLSKAVGPAGRVTAQDLYPDFLAKARAFASEKGLANVDFIQGTAKEAKLPAGQYDLILTLDAYHHFDFPLELTRSVHQSLKPGGRFVIVDYYKRPGAMAGIDAVEHVRLDIDGVIQEVTSQGFTLVRRGEHLPGSQWLAEFRK